MTADDFDFLRSTEARDLIDRHITEDPGRIALTLRHPHAALIATQIKYLQRAKTKLPSYYEARCIIPSLAFEQSSSEFTAAHKPYEGNVCIDLTCGLGVDSFAFSRRFKRVIALERDDLFASIARYNFDRLGVKNIEVRNISAEEFIANWATVTNMTCHPDNTMTNRSSQRHHNPKCNGYPSIPVDLVYADPARRDGNNQKLVTFETCSPNILQLLPTLQRLTRKTVVKASPLFDIDEAFRLFGSHTRVEVVSLQGECKEVLIETGDHLPDQYIRATALGYGSIELPYRHEIHINTTRVADRGRHEQSFAQAYCGSSEPLGSKRSTQADHSPYTSSTLSGSQAPEPTQARYLIVPDVALYKARLIDRVFGPDVRRTSQTGYCFADRIPTGLLGRAYPITDVFPFRPKTLKKLFRERGIDRLTMLKKDFPLSTSAIASQLGIREGGTLTAAFTQIDGERLLFLLGKPETA